MIRIKYLLLLSSLELGGAEKQAIYFAEYLNSKGYEVQIAGLRESGKVNKICNDKGIACRSLLGSGLIHGVTLKICHRIGLFNVTEEMKNLLPLVDVVERFVKKERFDVCISYCALANTVLGLTKKKLGVVSPFCVWYQRDAGIFDKIIGLQRVAIESMDCVIANGLSGKNWIKKAYGIDAELIYNGVLLEPTQRNRQEWRDDLGISEDDIVCTMLANLSKQKNHFFLLKIWKKLLDSGKEYKLVLAGRFDEEYPVLMKYVADNNMSNNIFFLGQISDISGLISATDICVFSTFSEGSPNGVIEPAIFGLPVVATDLPEIREILFEENYMYLFDQDDIERAVNNIVALAENEELRKKIGVLNKEKVSNMFSYEKNFEKLICFINRKV